MAFDERDRAARRIQKNWRDFRKQRGLQRMASLFGGLGFMDIVKAAVKKKAERDLTGLDLGEDSRMAGKWRHKVNAARHIGGGFQGGSRQSDQEQGAGWMGLEEANQNRGADEGGAIIL